MRLLFALLLCAMSSNALAHEMRPAFLKLTELPGTDSSTRFEASFRQPQINGRFLGLNLATNCLATNVSVSVSEGALTEVFELECGSDSLTRIEIIGLDRTLIDTLVSLSWLDGTTVDRLITGQQASLDLSSELPGLPIYLSIGVKHLLLGYDHILFLLMLLYLVRSPSAILKVVTSFTVAHSFTLALSAFDILRLSQTPVEAIISSSIVLLAYENLRKKPSVSHSYPVFIAFSFGLLHGLGFAGALAEIGLPEGNRLAALLFFNLGIEIGQLLIVAVVLLLVAGLRLKFNRLNYKLPIYLTGGIASYWFLQRSWLILIPLFR